MDSSVLSDEDRRKVQEAISILVDLKGSGTTGEENHRDAAGGKH